MQDVLIDNAGSMQVMDGDWQVGPSDSQHLALLLITGPGEWKQSVLTGVGITRYVEAERPGELLREVRQQLAADGYTLAQHSGTNGKLTIHATKGAS